MQETAAPPQASMMVRLEERVRVVPEAWVTVSGRWRRERWRRAGFSGDSFWVAEGWKVEEGGMGWGLRGGGEVLWGAMARGWGG